jgi:signal transduction histidine kinase
MLMMLIQDDGQGLEENFDINALSENGHYGLIGISERVALLGGRFRLQDVPSGGAQLLVEIPHPRIDTIQETIR